MDSVPCFESLPMDELPLEMIPLFPPEQLLDTLHTPVSQKEEKPSKRRKVDNNTSFTSLEASTASTSSTVEILSCVVINQHDIPEPPSPLEITLHCVHCDAENRLIPQEGVVVPGPGDENFTFTCSKCTGGRRKLVHHNKTWSEILITAIFNLELVYQRQYFHWKLEICDFIERNWSYICKGKHTKWMDSVQSIFTQFRSIFESNGRGYWGIRYQYFHTNPDLPHIRSAPSAASSSPSASSQPRVKNNSKSENSESDSSKAESSSSPEKPHIPVTCHQCRARKENTIICSKCAKRWCAACLWNHYKLKISELARRVIWTCLKCKNKCTCISCRRHRGEAPRYRRQPASSDTNKDKQKLRVVNPQNKQQKQHKQKKENKENEVKDRTVERVIGRAIKYKDDSAQCKYFIKWSGEPFTECSWEKEKSFSVELLENFTKSPKIIIKSIHFNHIKQEKRNTEVTVSHRRRSEFDLDRFVTYGVIPTPIVKTEKQKISVPSWRIIDTHDMNTDDNDNNINDSESEDTSDEFYEKMHHNYLMSFASTCNSSPDKDKKKKRKQQCSTIEHHIESSEPLTSK